MKDWVRVSLFILFSAILSYMAMIVYTFTVFINFVFPPIMGPILQGLSFVLVILGCLIIMKQGTSNYSVYIILSIIIGIIAEIVAAKEFKISLIGIKGYALGCILIALSIYGGSRFLYRTLPRIDRKTQILASIFLIITGLTVPASIASWLAVDLL